MELELLLESLSEPEMKTESESELESELELRSELLLRQSERDRERAAASKPRGMRERHQSREERGTEGAPPG